MSPEPVDEPPVDELPVDELPVDQLPVDQLPVDQPPDEPVVRYFEPARPYRSIFYSLGVLAAGIGIDFAIGVHGAVTHLPGWLFFGGVIIAIQALILYAARATHSLSLTDEELRIGDEVVPVASIAGVIDVVPEDAPVLGWPGGRPRGVPSLVLRLDDERDVEVPTRFPDRLRAALGVADTPSEYEVVVRVANDEDLALVPEIDERAEAIFRVAGYELPDIRFDTAWLDGAAVVFVAGDPPVGFAVVDLVDSSAHLAELAVLPRAMRRGIGTELVDTVCTWARAHGHATVTLTTYADVPWNGPFYRRLGFVDASASDIGPDLRGRREREARLGLDAVGRRIVMRREL